MELMAKDPGQFEMFPEPPANYTVTSQEAARSIELKAPTLRQKVFAYVFCCGLHGATNEEISVQLSMPLQTVCARRNELVKMGRLQVTEKQRKTVSGRMAEVVIAPPQTWEEK